MFQTIIPPHSLLPRLVSIVPSQLSKCLHPPKCCVDANRLLCCHDTSLESLPLVYGMSGR